MSSIQLLTYRAREELLLKVTSLEGTLAVGYALGAIAKAGTIITLDGDLGAGKTALTRGIAEGLGIPSEEVTSPTFTLQQVYGPGTRGLTLTHDDAYRLEDAESFLASGLDESFHTGGVTVIEWAERVSEAVDRVDLAISIERGDTGPATVDVDGQLVLPTDEAPRTIRIRSPHSLDRLVERLTDGRQGSEA